MTQAVEETEFRRHVQHLEKLLAEVESIADPTVAEKVSAIIQGLLEFHGVALAKVMDCISAAGGAGEAIIETMTRDELVGSLLLLHGLHPLDLEARVRQALGKVQPYLAAHHGHVELLGVSADGVVGLRLEGNCHGCPSSQATLKGAIEEAIYAAAPDVTRIEVEGVVEETPVRESGFVPVSQVTIHERPMYAGCGIAG